MAEREELLNTLKALDDLTDEVLIKFSDEDLKFLREMLDLKSNDISVVLRNRAHAHTHFPPKQ